MPVEVIRQSGGRKYPARGLKNIAAAILKLLDQHNAELSIALVGNSEIQQLNKKYRHKDYATDVLSFPADRDVPSQVHILGDVVISVDKAKEQAHERRRTLDEEMITLLIHGIVHLMGYDHERSARDARIMSRLERKIHRALCGQGIIEV